MKRSWRRRAMRSRWGALVATMAVATLAATACSPSDDNEGEGGGKVTLSLWSWRPEDASTYGKIFDKFEASHPNITVEFKPFKNTEYNNILATGLSGESGPDVAQLRAYGLLQPLVEAGRLVPLEGKVPGLDSFDPAILQGAKGRKDGKIYGVPFAYQTLQIFYNKKIFADNGIQPPTTWGEMIAAANRLKQADVIPFAATAGPDGTWTLPILHEIFGNARYGGKQFEQGILDGTKQFTDPNYVASIKLIKDLQPYYPDDVVGVTYPEAQTLFVSEKAAMYPGGSYELGFFTSQNPNLDIGIFQAPPPPGAVSNQPVTAGWADGSFGVSSKSKHQAEALELVKWMATPEFGQMFANDLKQLSAVPGVKPTDPLLTQMADNYAANGAAYMLLVDFRYGEPNGDAVFRDEVQKMLTGKASAEDVASSVQKGVSQWFEAG